MPKPRVLLLGTGGSISHVGRHALDLVEYSDGARIVEVDEFLQLVPALSEVAEIVPATLRAVRSINISPTDWLALNDAIHALVEQNAPIDGIVVTHGTATLEETAYFLNLTLKIEQTVVLVGAMRPLGVLSTDVDLNLVNAARVASDPNARGLGVLVVLNDEIQAAREVTKGSTHRLETFRTHDLGMLGYADPDGRVAIYRKPTRRHAPDTAFDVRKSQALPRIDIVYSYAGADGADVEAMMQRGTSGIVVAGLPPGNAPPPQEQALRAAAAQGVLVVRSSRAGSGRVIPREIFRRAGYVVADNLNPQKARVLAMLALAHTSDRDTIQRLFDEH